MTVVTTHNKRGCNVPCGILPSYSQESLQSRLKRHFYLLLSTSRELIYRRCSTKIKRPATRKNITSFSPLASLTNYLTSKNYTSDTSFPLTAKLTAEPKDLSRNSMGPIEQILPTSQSRDNHRKRETERPESWVRIPPPPYPPQTRFWPRLRSLTLLFDSKTRKNGFVHGFDGIITITFFDRCSE